MALPFPEHNDREIYFLILMKNLNFTGNSLAFERHKENLFLTDSASLDKLPLTPVLGRVK